MPGTVAGDTPLRRMFAAARVQFHRPLKMGAAAQMSESVLRSRDTVGSGGPLRIVTHHYVYRQDGRECISEERDIVYLTQAPQAPRTPDDAESGSRSRTTEPAHWSETITPDPVMLFRFSALTFNAHRIHYDQQYAQTVEGHRERVVHGPLTALLLAESYRDRRTEPLQRFEFRARRPLFVDLPISISGHVEGVDVRLRARDSSGAVAMEAVAILGGATAIKPA